MRQVNFRRVVRGGVLAAVVLGSCAATAAAQSTREIEVKVLGGPNRFSAPLHSTDDLRTMVRTNRTPLTSVFGQAGLGDLSGQLLDTLTVGEITTVTVAPGTHFEWMAMKRRGRRR
jgi:hypothetical protein